MEKNKFIKDLENLTFKDLVNLYLKEIKFNVADGTYSARRCSFNRLGIFFNDCLLSEIFPRDLNIFLSNNLLKYKPQTVRYDLYNFGTLWNYAVNVWCLNLRSSPSKAVKVRKIPLVLRFLTSEQLKILLSACYQHSAKLGDLVLLAVNTGLRKTELLLLRWCDVDFANKTIFVRAEITKTKTARLVPLNLSAIRALLGRRCEFYEKGKNNLESFVFPATSQKLLSKNGVWHFYNSFIKVKNEIGLNDFRFHDLRHTFASALVSCGVDLIKVRDLLGHSSIKMTERYAHLMKNDLYSAVSLLDDFFK